jgi:hypothetical protein
MVRRRCLFTLTTNKNKVHRLSTHDCYQYRDDFCSGNTGVAV